MESDLKLKQVERLGSVTENEFDRSFTQRMAKRRSQETK
jgi:hypothetical protein